MSLLSNLMALNPFRKVRVSSSPEPKPGDGKRNPEWPRVRAEWLKDHPACAACGATEGLIECHHKMPFHLDPSRELDPTNFITLCEIPGTEDHLHIGHLDDWQKYNPNVETDAANKLAQLSR